MEDTADSNDHPKTSSADLNGFVELANGEENNCDINSQEIPFLSIEELSNSNSNPIEDPLSNGISITTVDSEETQDSDLIAESIPQIDNVTENVITNDTTNNFLPDDTEQIDIDQLAQSIREIPEEEVENDLNFIITKEELELIDYNDTESIQPVSNLSIASVFTDSVGDNETSSIVEIPNSTYEPDSVSPISRRIMKSIEKQARLLTSAEFVWLIIQLVSKNITNNVSSEHIQIQKLIDKAVSDVSKKNLDDLLEQAQDFTLAEYSALIHKLKNSRNKEQPQECDKEFNQTIMWFKTHFEAEPEQFLSKNDLNTAYTTYCINRQLKQLKNTDFISLLRCVYCSVKERRRETKGSKRYLYAGIKKRTVLHPPRLPKFATDQLHNNLLISQYMSSHNCCSLYSSPMFQKPTANRPRLKIKFQGFQSKAGALNAPSIAVEDPLDLLNVSVNNQVRESIKQNVVEVVDLSQADDHQPKKMAQVAKKSVFPVRMKKTYWKPRNSTSFSNRNTNDDHSIDYLDKLLSMKNKLSKMVITKNETNTKYKVSCTCCNDVFFVTVLHGSTLVLAQEKLYQFFKNFEHLPIDKQDHHPSVKRLYYNYGNIILPENVVYNNISPAVKINRFEVYDWYKNEISTLKHKLLESALNALNSTSRRSRYELKMPGISSNTSTQITPSHPPIYISAVRETPKPREPDPPRVAEVFIKAEATGRKRTREEPKIIEISAQKRSRPNSIVPTSSTYSRNRTYNRRKESDFIYFPAIDTSPNNLRLANLGTLYKCILCLMLFNTQQKLFDHEQAHLTCRKCNRKLRDVEIMRIHLIKHCERNHRKNKPLLKIHRVDSIAIMVKKYGEIFEASKAYYQELLSKPKKKYREMIRPKVEPPPILPVEEIFIGDVKPNMGLLPELVSNNVDRPILETLLDVKPTLSSLDTPPVNEMPVLSAAVQQEPYTNVAFQQTVQNEPPKLIPFPSTSTNIKKKKLGKELNQRPFKIRVKDLIELS